MEKVLSIIVPTYNMEALLPRCLDSLASSGVIKKLDVLVVNDGSTDSSCEVARSFVGRYPESIRLIDKKNGNYGSTINAALPLATGEYVKILDSDDWFDPQALSEYVRQLDGLHGSADISVTHFHSIGKDGKTETIKYNVYGREPYEYERTYNLDHVLGGGHIRFFLMHSLAYRTKMLLDHGYHQSEGISYTDTQWASFPLFWAQTIVFHDITLYQYNLGRDGQTMDPAVIRKSLPQMEKMTMDMLDFYRKAVTEDLSETRLAFLKQYFRNRLRLLVKAHLLDIPRSEFNRDSFSTLDESVQKALSEFRMEQIRLIPENKLIRIDVYGYWHRHHDRLPSWLESLVHTTDIVVKRVFSMLFH